MNDDFLYKYRKPPRREFAAALYQKISQGTGGSTPMKTKIRALRVAALALSIVAVITAALFFSPSTRALAQSIMRQFGGYVFVQGTPQPDPSKEEINQKKAMATGENRVKVSSEQEATLTAAKMQMKDQPSEKPITVDKYSKLAGNLAPDAAAASQITGFTVLAPSYVPAGYTPGDEKNITGGWEIAQVNGGVSAMTRYESQTDKSFFVVEELKYEQGQPTTVERPQIVDVTVRGQPGAWMPDDGGKSTLAWDENGITYLIVGNKLTLDEALKVAESLGK
jgi:hypothetical protein